ncbi:MAG: YceD family protein [Coriobacteriales bacterium]|jgi:uncharacterized protein|nr:YceD family protein [Coriobacteriales bacterium]
MDTIPNLSYNLLAELDEPYANRELAGRLSCTRLTRGTQDFALADGISYELTLANTGEGILLTGTAHATGTTECARCLEEAAFEVTGEVVGYFILNPSQHDEELSDDEFTVVGPDGIVDLAVPVVAAVIYELPQVLLCKEDCAGLCPICGANLNEQDCGCADEPRSDHPFAVLKDLIGD